ncbi:MAG: hypothetical protein V7724_00045 [Sediminicola sp.]
MFRLKPFLSSQKNPRPSLTELDGIYKRAISDLPPKTRKEYCERLVHRAQFEIKHCECKNEIKQLKLLKKAAIEEMAVLQGR